jgi:hypothetical protein
LRKMVLLRWSVGAVGAGSVPGGAVGGARFGVINTRGTLSKQDQRRGSQLWATSSCTSGTE